MEGPLGMVAAAVCNASPTSFELLTGRPCPGRIVSFGETVPKQGTPVHVGYQMSAKEHTTTTTANKRCAASEFTDDGNNSPNDSPIDLLAVLQTAANPSQDHF